MINDGLKLSGALKIDVVDENGNLKDSRELKNLVVAAGLDFIAASMLKTTTDSPTAMTHIGIGDGVTAAAAGQTDLQGANKFRKAFTTAASVVSNVVTYTCLFGTADNIIGGAITEAGIFNDPTAGTMLCRTVFPVVNKGANDTMTITWTITLNAA